MFEPTDEFDDLVEDWDDEPQEQDWSGPLCRTYVSVDGYGGVAFIVDGDNGEQVKAHMVGDDRSFLLDRDDVTPIEREAFCGECGQIGCTHDGLDRD